MKFKKKMLNFVFDESRVLFFNLIFVDLFFDSVYVWVNVGWYECCRK